MIVNPSNIFNYWIKKKTIQVIQCYRLGCQCRSFLSLLIWADRLTDRCRQTIDISHRQNGWHCSPQSKTGESKVRRLGLWWNVLVSRRRLNGRYTDSRIDPSSTVSDPEHCVRSRELHTGTAAVWIRSSDLGHESHASDKCYSQTDSQIYQFHRGFRVEWCLFLFKYLFWTCYVFVWSLTLLLSCNWKVIF
jgi:hypothetical protein